jgi:hypothetical protein
MTGGSVRVVSLAGAFDEMRDLPAGGWTRTRRGYKYRDGEGTRLVIRTGSRLKLAIRGGDYVLDGDASTPILVAIRIGGRRLCLEFPTAELKSNGRRLIATDASPPSVCDEPAGP